MGEEHTLRTTDLNAQFRREGARKGFTMHSVTQIIQQLWLFFTWSLQVSYLYCILNQISIVVNVFILPGNVWWQQLTGVNLIFIQVPWNVG